MLGLKMTRIIIYLAVFLFHQFIPQTNAQERVEYDFCYIEEGFHLEKCKHSTGLITHTTGQPLLQSGTVCNLIKDNQTFLASCIDGVFIIVLNKESLERVKRTANISTYGPTTGSDIPPDDDGSVRGLPIVDASSRSLLGSVFNFFHGVVCFFFCHHSKPPPQNTPPQISRHTALTVRTPIFAGEGKTTARVSWTVPEIIDKEDGKLQVVSSPPIFRNGGEYSEGSYMVYFVGTDSGGLSVTENLSFEVKVQRCVFRIWPDNGYIDCGGNSIMYGSICSVKCKKGYVLDAGGVSTLRCGESGLWSPSSIPDCKPRACENPPFIEHGAVQCLNNQMAFDNICEVVCDDGYQVHGMHLTGCDEFGRWVSVPVCRDTSPPRFLSGECPGDMQIYVDSTNNTAVVEWNVPKGIDNSKENVTIIETHGYAPGQRISAGTHLVKYTIEDMEHNFGESCAFSVQVLSLSCSPPSLNVVGADHLRYDCPDAYRIGAKCYLGCKSGYPMGGANQIQCLMEQNTFPPKHNWQWEMGALSPICKETNCSRAALHEPLNGALACSEWTHGQMCQMQCEAGFDIPNIGDGQFVCGRSNGQWRPTSKVPDCETRIDVNHIHLPNEFYYYTGRCNSSSQNLLQIQDNFVKALNTSKYFEECLGVPECQAKFVDVTCGPVSSRKRRDIDGRIVRSSAVRLAYILRFDIVLPIYHQTRRNADVFQERESQLYRISDVIQKEVKAGHFDLHIADMHVDSDSYDPGIPSMVCPNGTVPRKETRSCVGCPKGSFFDGGRCRECPIGSYEDTINSLKCKPCPPNTNTTEEGAHNMSQCLAYCSKGEFSQNGLAPCTKCSSNSYQTSTRSTHCIKCSSNQRTSVPGDSLQSQCQAYDVQTSRQPILVKTTRNIDAMTLFMWTKIANANTINVTIILRNRASSDELMLKLHPTLTIAKSRSMEINIGRTLSVGKWSSVALTMDRLSNEIKLFVNGNEVYSDISFSFSSSHILEENDILELQGVMTVSSFTVIPRIATPSEIAVWSSTCTPTIHGALITMDDISETENVIVVIPSVCDALDECDSSPCGTFECTNKLGGFECRCDGGFRGLQCQTPPNLCKDSRCQNGAACVQGTKNYTCICDYGFRGDLCEIKAVDGQWSIWTVWTGCSQSCGGGVMTRNRLCDSPPPDPEGASCVGSGRETKQCEEQVCPGCVPLKRTYGLTITCYDMSEVMHCVISCRNGLYFTTTPLPYYECGLATGYIWNHQNEENPTARLPSCSELSPPSELGVSFEGHYETLPCTDRNMITVKENIELKLQLVDCKMTEMCETSIQSPRCRNESSIVVTIDLHARIDNNTGALNDTDVPQNHTAPELVELVRQVLELEKSAQKVLNNSKDFFQVTVDGKRHTVGSSQLNFYPVLVCPSGTIRVEVFCVECPEGSYADGDIIKMCPRGTYQDKKRQSSCKPCPDGKTTAGIGSVYESECSVNAFKFSAAITSQHSDDNMKIAIGVTVPVGFIICCVGALIFAKRNGKCMQIDRCRDSLRNIHDNKFQNGSDYLGGKNGSDFVGGKTGSDRVGGKTGSDRVGGKTSSDRVGGKTGSDRDCEKNDNDSVDGKTGSDPVGGQTGSDRVGGKTGSDRVGGKNCNDRVGGRTGSDRVGGKTGYDRVGGKTGNDRVGGKTGNDRVGGKTGNDRVGGKTGNDRVGGKTGNDRVGGKTGNDRVGGKTGNDRVGGKMTTIV